MNYIIMFIIISIIFLPGFYVNGILINFIDFAIPISCFYVGIVKMKIIKEQKYLFIYILAMYMSLIVAELLGIRVDVSIILKSTRVLFSIFIYNIIRRYIENDKYDINKVIKLILYSGCASAILGILFFASQINVYRAGQTMYFMGKVMYRAGGVFAEAGTFSLMMSLLTVFAIETFLKSKFRVLSLTCLILCLIGIVISDTRIAFIAITCVLVISLCSIGKIKIKNIVLAVGIIAISLIVYNNNVFLQRYVNERVINTLTGLFMDSSSKNEISSGRFMIWKERIGDYFSSDFIQIVFGKGYKVTEDSLADNNYISAFYNTGIIGGIAFISFWLINVKKLFVRLRGVRDKLIYKIYRNCLIVYLIYMFTCDAMTMVRPFYFFIVISTIYYYYIKSIVEVYNKDN